MTFRDTSADVTLNNANEEIMKTKYGRSDPRNPDPKGDFAHRAKLEADIDALKKEIAELLEARDLRVDANIRLADENAALKAENERLRSLYEDAVKGRSDFREAYRKSLAAMKDFSTTTKEDGAR